MFYVVFRGHGGAAGALSARIDDVLGCGRPVAFFNAHKFPGSRFECLAVQELSFVRVGVDVFRANDFSTQLTQENFTNALKPIPTSSTLWASRQRHLSH